jgi:hypothetical protein
MRLEAKKYLYDIQQAAARVAEFTTGKHLEDYRSNAMLRAAVERQFEIIGEACATFLRCQSCSPNGFDPGGLDSLVAGYEGQAQVESGGRDDTVRHVGNDVARDSMERVGHLGIHGSYEKPTRRVPEGGL